MQELYFFEEAESGKPVFTTLDGRRAVCVVVGPEDFAYTVAKRLALNFNIDLLPRRLATLDELRQLARSVNCPLVGVGTIKGSLDSATLETFCQQHG